MACGRERNGTRAEIRFECNEARTEDLIRGEKVDLRRGNRFEFKVNFADHISSIDGKPSIAIHSYVKLQEG